MALLCIDLQDGFENDEVHIRVKDVELYRRQGLTTQRLLGVADSVRIPMEEGLAAIEIAVPSRGLTWTKVVEIAGDLHLGISVEGEIRVHQSTRPFGYA
jgi:hypothetical protein